MDDNDQAARGAASALAGQVFLLTDALRATLGDAAKSDDIEEVRRLITEANGFVDSIVDSAKAALAVADGEADA